MKAPHLVLFGHFGVNNFGNDSTMEAMLHNIKKLQPSAEVTCVCTGPKVIAERFGIQTLPVDVSEFSRGNLHTNRLFHIINRIADEVVFWFTRINWFRSVDQFAVVGTGALDDMAVHPWNAPYDLFKWCLAAKLGRTKLIFISVGAGPIKNRISRALMITALRFADYRSYRDEASMLYLRNIGFDTSGDCIYPDLVFSFPVTEPELNLANETGPKTVGLGVIGYYGWRHDLDSGEEIYQSYVAKLKKFVKWLLEHGYVIRLLIGNLGVDQRPVDDLLVFVRKEGQADWRNRIISEKIDDVNELFQQIEQTDIVVASRFHNVLCALMMGRPVISIGYHEKNDDLMTEMGLQSYCQHIERFKPESLIQQFQSLTLDGNQASQRIQTKCAQYRKLLDEQYRIILGDKFSKA